MCKWQGKIRDYFFIYVFKTKRMVSSIEVYIFCISIMSPYVLQEGILRNSADIVKALSPLCICAPALSFDHKHSHHLGSSAM